MLLNLVLQNTCQGHQERLLSQLFALWLFFGLFTLTNRQLQLNSNFFYELSTIATNFKQITMLFLCLSLLDVAVVEFNPQIVQIYNNKF